MNTLMNYLEFKHRHTVKRCMPKYGLFKYESTMSSLSI